MKICLVIGTMMTGGAHRVACMQANELVARGYDVTVLLVVNSVQRPYPLFKEIGLCSCFEEEDLTNSSVLSKVKRKIFAPIAIFLRLKEIKPDVVISHIQSTNREAILSCSFLRIPIIACEHTSIKMPYGLAGKMAYIDRRFIYKLANKITVLTNKDYESFYSKYLKNVTVFNNPTPFSPCESRYLYKKNKVIVAVGDLNRHKIKGFDSLLNVFSRISDKYPEWRLKIAGSGNEGEAYLKEQIGVLKLGNRVELLGNVTNVEHLLKLSSIFLLTSRNEGFPMALIEAMSQGCACLAFDCPTGPAEIIEHEIDGILVSDQNLDEMTSRLEQVLNDTELRQSLSLNALKNSGKFSIKTNIDMLEDMVRDVINEK